MLLVSSVSYKYTNKTNYLSEVKHSSPLSTYYGSLANGQMPDCVYGVTWNGAEKVSYSYDALGRLTNKKVGPTDTDYTYIDVDDNRTTTLVKSVSTAVGTFTYTYDNVGNILSISDGTYTTSYEYDGLNQLVRENDQKAGKTYTYSYTNGNITSRKEYAYTTDDTLGAVVDEKTYTYGNSVWADLLTNFNGEEIEYDDIGNPKKIGSKEYSWLGRQLEQIKEGSNVYSYKYNADGQRVSKTVNGKETKYYYNGSILAGQKSDNDTLVFMYDNNGEYFGFTYLGFNFYYIKNAQNDVIGISNQNGMIIVEYDYDAWGNVTSITGNLASTLGELNPIRYRSYYYDNETGYYHLKTRYYDPEIGRFINADDSEILLEDQDSLMQYNLYSYCFNNPVNMADDTGESPANIIGGIIGGVAGAALGVLLAKKLGLTGWKKWALISAATVGGAVLGAFLGPYVARLAKSIGSAVKTTVKTVAKKAPKSLCFVAGTLVLSKDGKIPIEKIKEGDYVYSENPETGECELKRVVQVFESETTQLVHVVINDEKIITTPGHPFYVYNKGWIGAEELEIGDKVILYNGEKATVNEVNVEHLKSPIKVYNFEVEDFHTYFVGEFSVLVHNKGCGFTRYSAKQLSKMVKGSFHGSNGIKNEILKQAGSKVLKQVGRNPDIAIAKDGTIMLVSTIKKGVSIITSLNINDF